MNKLNNLLITQQSNAREPMVVVGNMMNQKRVTNSLQAMGQSKYSLTMVSLFFRFHSQKTNAHIKINVVNDRICSVQMDKPQ